MLIDAKGGVESSAESAPGHVSGEPLAEEPRSSYPRTDSKQPNDNWRKTEAMG